MIGFKASRALASMLLVTTAFCQQIQIPYDLRGRGVPTLQSQGNVLRVISPIFGQQDDGFAFVGSDFGDSSAGSRNVFGDNSFSSGASTQSDRSFQDIFGESRGQPGGTFPGTMFSPNFLGGQQGSFLGGRVSTGRVPSPAGVIQAQFGGDAGLGVNFAGLPSPPVFLQDQFRGDGSLGSSFPAGSVLQFGGDAGFGGGIAPGTAFQPLSPSFAGSSRVIEARPDVTLTRTITEDRFVTTTNVAFVKEPRTATIFSFVTQTAVTTVVVPTPVDRSVVISTALVTRAPVTVTVTDVRSEFQYVTRTEVQYITLTHTSRRFTQETLTTTVTRVQTVASTVVRTNVNTVTTTFTDIRTITSTVFTGYY